MAKVVILGEKEIQVKLKELETAPVKSIHKVAVVGRRLAHRLAPRKSGKLEAGIKWKKINPKEYHIISKAINPKTNYPYNLWVNLDITSWGKTYSQVAGTGTPGFFRETARALNKRYAKEVNLGISQVITK